MCYCLPYLLCYKHFLGTREIPERPHPGAWPCRPWQVWWELLPCPPILAQLHPRLHGREPNGRTRSHDGTSAANHGLPPVQSGRQPNHRGDQGWQEGRAGQESSLAAKRFPLLLWLHCLQPDPAHSGEMPARSSHCPGGTWTDVDSCKDRTNNRADQARQLLI